MNKILTTVAVMLFATASYASEFDRNFADSTLRLDYTFLGTAESSSIGLDRIYATEGWYGKRVHLNEIPLKGNGQIVVRDTEKGDTLYYDSFSSLYLEWVDTDEARQTQRSMQAVMRIPMPKNPVDITVTIFDHNHNPSGSIKHRVNPAADNLIRRISVKDTVPHRYIHKSGDPKDKIDVAILAEGYTPEEMESFYNAAETATEAILSHEPFKSMKDRFNFVAVATPSKDSGVSIPRFNDWKNTAFSSHFGTFYSNRYLTTSNVFDIHDSLGGIPYEHIIILANTPEYGGGGIYNSYTLTSAGHSTFKPVVVHEFGHSFGGLADEYFYDNDPLMSGTYPLDIEPWEQNITTLKDFGSKWQDMLPEGTPVPGTAVKGDQTTVGVYEGGGYTSKGVYRPVDACRMRYNTANGFCPVCQRAIARVIEFYAPAKK